MCLFVCCVLVYWCVRRYMQVFMHRSIRCCCVREEVFFFYIATGRRFQSVVMGDMLFFVTVCR